MDTDATAFLNAQLSKKPNIKVARKRTETRWTCKTKKIAGDLTEICFPHDVTITEEVLVPASVTESEIVEVRNFQMLPAKTKTFPINARVKSELFKNCNDKTTLTKTFTLSVSVTTGWTVAKTRGVSTTLGGAITISGNIDFVKAAGTVSFSQTVSSSTALTETASTTTNRSSTDVILIPPHSAGAFNLMAYEETLEIPFSALVIVDGPLISNISGLVKASEILSIAERTIQFEGALTITDASRGETSITFKNWEIECAEDEKEHSHYSRREFSVPASALSESFLSGFKKPSEHARINNAITRPIKAAGSEIGPPADGRLFETLYMVEEMRGDFGNCGFNDLGIPNTGVYEVSHGMWHEFQGGKEVATYPGTQEEFLRCYVP